MAIHRSRSIRKMVCSRVATMKVIRRRTLACTSEQSTDLARANEQSVGQWSGACECLLKCSSCMKLLFCQTAGLPGSLLPDSLLTRLLQTTGSHSKSCFHFSSSRSERLHLSLWTSPSVLFQLFVVSEKVERCQKKWKCLPSLCERSSCSSREFVAQGCTALCQIAARLVQWHDTI